VKGSKTCAAAPVDADAVVADAHDDPARLARDVDFEPAVVRRVLRRVVQQVAEHLRQSREIALHPDRRGGMFTDSLCCLASSCERAVSMLWDSTFASSTGCFLQRDLALGDARHVEQVVDDLRHVRDLPLHDLASPREPRIVGGDLAHDLRGAADRRQWVTELVRQHREDSSLRRLAC